MTVPALKRLAIILGVSCLGLALVSAVLFLKLGLLRVQTAFADDQTHIFDEMRTRALQTNVTDAADCLRYVVAYYPSGSKQQSGSRLDRVVERHRQLVIGDIVRHLRAKSDRDLGEDPAAWIQKDAIGQ